MKRAVVIGASSGIGRELAVILSSEGYTVGLAARRLHLIEELKENLPGPAYLKQIDVADPVSAMDLLEQLISEMGGADLIVISAGTGALNPGLEWTEEKRTIDTNVSGFTAMANAAFRHFEQAGRGHLVGISSIAAIRGSRQSPAYNASKAFEANYLEGLRARAMKARLPIVVTDIQPGLVDTRMAQGEGLFWVASPQKAARQIYDAIERKAKLAYVTKRWSLIAWLLKILPDSVYARI
ncbi:MAG: SDR family NAD(P)-dependent oxidoreductase [Syntrophobacteraceae bacterium]